MSERKTSRSKRRSRHTLRQKYAPAAKIAGCVALAAAVVAASLFAFRDGDDAAGIPLARIKRDLTRESATVASLEEASESPAEPARLEMAATSQARSATTDETASHGPLFNGSLEFSAEQTDPIEVTQFQPTTSTGRVQANQAVWLTGRIEPVE